MIPELFVRNDTRKDHRFELMNSFEFIVPPDYVNDTQLTTFAKYAEQKKHFFCKEIINDQNFARVTKHLLPGKTYIADIFGIKRGHMVSSKDCLAFQGARKALFVGAQGLSLIGQIKSRELPAKRWTISFDKKDALWQNKATGCHLVPFAYQYPNGICFFSCGNFEDEWFDGSCLLSVSDKIC
jgi:hypothetical protein